MAVSCRRPSSYYASVWGCQRNYWTMLTTAGAATLGHGRLVCPAALSLRSVSFRFSFRMHNEQFNLENADFIRFLLFIQEMSRSIAHVAAPTPLRHLGERVCNYIHICQRIMPVDLLGVHWWDQLMIVAMINRLKIIYPAPPESNTRGGSTLRNLSYVNPKQFSLLVQQTHWNCLRGGVPIILFYNTRPVPTGYR